MSALRCWPGDLAVVVKLWSQRDMWLIGRVVTVTVLTSHPVTGEPGWKIDQWLTTPAGDRHNCVLDSMLKPIRDPGDDAVDESLTWLPSPSREREAA